MVRLQVSPMVCENIPRGGGISLEGEGGVSQEGGSFFSVSCII